MFAGNIHVCNVSNVVYKFPEEISTILRAPQGYRQRLGNEWRQVIKVVPFSFSSLFEFI